MRLMPAPAPSSVRASCSAGLLDFREAGIPSIAVLELHHIGKETTPLLSARKCAGQCDASKTGFRTSKYQKQRAKLALFTLQGLSTKKKNDLAPSMTGLQRRKNVKNAKEEWQFCCHKNNTQFESKRDSELLIAARIIRENFQTPVGNPRCGSSGDETPKVLHEKRTPAIRVENQIKWKLEAFAATTLDGLGKKQEDDKNRPRARIVSLVVSTSTADTNGKLHTCTLPSVLLEC